MNSITQFEFPATGQTVRTVLVDGEPWFVATDVCRALGIANASDAMSRISDADKGVGPTDTPGGLQQVRIVSESGLYDLILDSRKPQARAFRRWITSEVIPSIRRTGSYSVAPERPMSELEMAQRYVAALEREQQLTAKVAELEPKAAAVDAYLSAPSGGRLIREVAQLLGMREKQLRQFLVDERLVYARYASCATTQYDAYATVAHHFRPVETVVNHMWGQCSHFTLYVLPSGVELIRKRLGAQQIIAS